MSVEKSGNRERRVEKSHRNCFVVMKYNHFTEQNRGMRWQPWHKWRSAPFPLKCLLDAAVKIQLNHVCQYVSALTKRICGKPSFTYAQYAEIKCFWEGLKEIQAMYILVHLEQTEYCAWALKLIKNHWAKFFHSTSSEWGYIYHPCSQHLSQGQLCEVEKLKKVKVWQVK